MRSKAGWYVIAQAQPGWWHEVAGPYRTRDEAREVQSDLSWRDRAGLDDGPDAIPGIDRDIETDPDIRRCNRVVELLGPRPGGLSPFDLLFVHIHDHWKGEDWAINVPGRGCWGIRDGKVYRRLEDGGEGLWPGDPPGSVNSFMQTYRNVRDFEAEA